MPRKLYLMNALRFTIAGTLLWVDQRLFFLYWFMLMLKFVSVVDALDVRLKVYFLHFDIRSLLILEKQGLSGDALDQAAAVVQQRVTTPEQLAEIDRRWNWWFGRQG